MMMKTWLKTSIASLMCVVVVGFSNAKESSKLEENKFQVGSLVVEKHGVKGSPIILIPGLSSGAYVWDETVKQLKDDHVLYVVTLAGFNGVPAMEGPKLAKAKQSLLELIQSQKIDKPVLVGHSLGAALSTWFAQEHSNLIGGVFAVDGLPVFPRTENMPAAQRPAMAQGMRGQMAAASQEVFAGQQLQYMRTTGVVDEKLAQTLATLSAKSDKVAVAEYMADLLMMDIRADLGKIKVPFTMISPYYAPDFAAMNISEEAKTAYYASLIPNLPQLKMVSISGSRHYPMYDQPKIFAEKLQEFLNSVK
jgi:pimeloyl-ACP methyl ester carboxylesterase